MFKGDSTKPCAVEEWLFPCLSHSDRCWLNRDVSAVEILATVKEMGALKALGPNGFPPLFFQ